MVVLDVDGTLLTSDARLTRATVAAVGRAGARGLEVCLATSRGPGGLRWVVGRLGLEAWVVAYQGALVGRLDRAGALAGPPPAERPLPAAAARAVLAEAAALGLSASWFAGPDWFALADDPAMRREAGIVRDAFVVAGPPADGHDPHKLMLIAGHPDLVPSLLDLAGRLPPDCAGHFSHDNYLEVTRADVDRPVPWPAWPPAWASPWPRWPRSATARTTSTCSARSASPSPWATPSRPSSRSPPLSPAPTTTTA